MRTRLLHALTALCALSLTLGASAVENLIQNPGFEEGVVDPWTSYGAVELSVTNDAYDGDFALEAKVLEKGANFWDSGVQYHPDISFAANTTYTWALFFKSDPPVEINMKPELAADPWTGYGESRQNLTSDWAEYYVEFTPDADVNPASLTLHVAFDVATIWIDNARWYVGTYTPAELPTAVEPEGKLATTWGSLKQR